MVGRDGIRAVAPAFGVVEVSIGGELEVEGEFVEMLRDLMIVVEILVEIRLAVPVQVAQDRDLVAAEHVNVAIDNGKAQRLEHAAGDPLPGQFFERLADAIHDPHVPAPGADCRAAVIFEKIEPAEAQPRAIGIVNRMGEDVDGIGAIVVAEFALRDEFLGPVRRAAPRQWLQVGRILRGPHHFGEGVKPCFLRRPPDEDRKPERVVSRRDRQS